MMRHTDARFAGKLGLTLVVAIVAVLAFASVVSAQPPEPLGTDIPSMPHWFKGNVTTDKNKPLAVGSEVTARATTGSWAGEAATVVDRSEQVWLESDLLCPRVRQRCSGQRRQER